MKDNKMNKILALSTFLLFTLTNLIFAQEYPEETKKLNFLLGEWKSIAINQNTGEEIIGKSIIERILNGKWLQWNFEARIEQGPLEVITLINYNKEKKQYMFYSFNPFDEEPIPHYGNWFDENTLKIETDFQGEKVQVEFNIKENGDFNQIHSKKNSSDERIITSITKYIKIK